MLRLNLDQLRFASHTLVRVLTCRTGAILLFADALHLVLNFEQEGFAPEEIPFRSSRGTKKELEQILAQIQRRPSQLGERAQETDGPSNDWRKKDRSRLRRASQGVDEA